MKVLHLVPSYIPANIYGGPVESVHAMNAALVKAGADVTVYTTSVNGSEDLRVPIGVPVILDGVKIFYFKTSFPRAWFYSPAFVRKLSETVDDFDIVRITSVFLSFSFFGSRVCRKHGKPYALSPHGSLMKDPLSRKRWKKKLYLKLLERKVLSSAAAIFFTTAREEEDYTALGFPLKRGSVIPNTIIPEKLPIPSRKFLRSRLGISESAKVVLFMGRLHPIKGLDTLIPAFAQVAHKIPEAVLLLAGPDEGDLRKKTEEDAKRLGINRKVFFSGLLEGEDKCAAFSESDVFVLPSYSESFGMSALEAMFFGKPVVVTDGVALSTAIMRAGAGRVVKKEIHPLAEAIESFLSEPAEAERAGERGRELVEREFFPEKVADSCLREYRDILGI